MSHGYTLEYQLRDTRLELGRITAQLLQTIDDLRKIKSAHREHVSQLENDYRYELSRIRAEKDVQATQLKRTLEDAETQRDAWRTREADAAEQLEQSKSEVRDLQEELDKMRKENEILKVDQDEARIPMHSPSTPHGKRKGRADSLLGGAASPMNIVEEESSSIPWPQSLEDSIPIKKHVPYPTPPFKRHRHYVSVSKPGSSLFVPPALSNQTNDSEDDVSTSLVPETPTSSSSRALPEIISATVHDLPSEEKRDEGQKGIEITVRVPITPSTSPQLRRVGRPKPPKPRLSAKDLMIAAQRETAEWAPREEWKDDAREIARADRP